MKKAVYHTTEEREILDKVFRLLVERGLENASIRELSRGTGIAQGSLYYWFSDKVTIISEATEYGLKKVTDEIFEYVFSKIDDLADFFENCLNHIGCYKQELRFIYQMVASPVYGEKIRKDGKYFKAMYDKYAVQLAEYLHYDIKKVQSIVYLLISAILDYAVWDDKENAQAEIDFIYDVLQQVMDT